MIILFIIITGCTSKLPIKSNVSTVLIKTPKMKFHDKGFINYFDDYINVQLLSMGSTVLNLSIYKEKICKGSFQCLSSKEFNNKYFSKNYRDDFLYELFMQKKIYFKDKKNKILINVK